MAIPPFDPDTGLLPPGEHEANWDEIEARFGWTLRRRQLLDGLGDGLAILAQANCSLVWLNGSFVTDKDEPGDFDCVWSPTGVDRQLLGTTPLSCSTSPTTEPHRRPASEASSYQTSPRELAANSSLRSSRPIETAPANGS